MSDVIVGTIRTFVPALIGTLLAFAANKGFDLGLDANAVGAGFAAVVIAIYYGIVRKLETRWPWLGVFLGSTKQPVYDPPPGDPYPVDPAGDPTDAEL